MGSRESRSAKQMRREGRILILATVAGGVSFLALVAAGPFIITLRRFWAYYGVA